jgi:lipopolysaccharide transport system ATP-binding protein
MLSDPAAFLRKRKSTSQPSRYENSGSTRYFWALRNINIEIRAGESVAILGRNGAGKSTLLKVLVGIMSPSEGEVQSSAKIVPLMGVGSGFHPELTGRENVFLYGGILGMPKSFLQERYQSIVDFAEIPNFMDTPLKRYSKGMRARLGMAVALSVDPEVLVVDEVLAVGDVAFRAKCMDAMKAMREKGMTLLFVSHSPARVKSLCDRAILLREGALIDDGDVHQVLQRYLNEDVPQGPLQESKGSKDGENNNDNATTTTHNYLARVDWPEDVAPGDPQVVQITMIRVTDVKNAERQDFDIREPVVLEMEYIVHDESSILRPQFQIFDTESEVLFASIDRSTKWRKEPRSAGKYRSRAKIPGNLLAPGTYTVGASVYTHTPLQKHARTMEIVSFKVFQPQAIDLDTAQSDYPKYFVGAIRPLLDWETEFESYESRALQIAE